MASKKYLGLDEVAARLGVASDQVNKLREEGRLRGFADRGTWKFKSDDVEEFARSRQADSAPDVPIFDLPLDDEAIVSPSGIRRGGSAVSDDDGVGEQPTVIRGDMTGSSILDEEPLLNASDSDVRLILDDNLVGGGDSAPEVDVQADSDSDVRLMDPKAGGRAPAKSAGGRSDSDVKLISDEGDTVSDVRLLSGDDVPMAKSGSDSDVALVSPGKGGTSVFDDEEELRPLAADSGIALEHIADSGISLDAPSTVGRGRGVPLEDSVVVGPGGESSIISLADSGISLDEPKKRGSGIQRGGPTDSGIALEALGGGATMPMMRTTGRDSDAGNDTQFEVEAAGDSEFELAMSGEVGTGNDTSVILLEEEDSFVAQPPSSRKGARKQPAVEQFVAAEGDDVVEIEDDFDAFDEEGGSAVAVSDEDEDLEFEAADEDFDEGFQTGESQADFAPAGQRVVVAAEPEFGMPTVVGLGATSLLLALCGMMMFDLVRSMWGYNDPTLSSWLLDSTKGLF